jgi:tricorn protease-like protein
MVVLPAFFSVAWMVSAEAAETTLVSVDSAGTQGNGHCYSLSLSADGRYVAFQSAASNLVPGDTNNYTDIFVHDRQTGDTARVSVSSSGAQGNSESEWPSISADGRYVAFDSPASNLVTGDTGYYDVFVHDRQTGQTARVSVSSGGAQGNRDSGWPSISADGRYVAFRSAASNLVTGDTNNRYDIFVHDRQTGQTSRVSMDSAGTQGNHDSGWPSISADGRYVAFQSYASNLVPGDTNNASDVFVHDRQTGQTSRVSMDSAGTQGNNESLYLAISADGRFVAFQSYASNLVPGDTNNAPDVFVHDRQTGQTTRASVSSSGAQGNSGSDWPSISADGRFVAFLSYASNLVPGDTNDVRDIFVHDRQTGQTTRASVSSSGDQGNSESNSPSISADGRSVAFQSAASNLVPGDTNGYQDIFVYDSQNIQAAPGLDRWGFGLLLLFMMAVLLTHKRQIR